MVMLQGDCRDIKARLQLGCGTKGCIGVKARLQQFCSNVAKRLWGNSREVLMRLQGGCRYIGVRLWQSCGEDV